MDKTIIKAAGCLSIAAIVIALILANFKGADGVALISVIIIAIIATRK